jgi:hypothetical protein
MSARRVLTVKRMVELGQISRASFYRFDESKHRQPDANMDLRDAIQRIDLEWPSYGRRIVRKFVSQCLQPLRRTVTCNVTRTLSTLNQSRPRRVRVSVPYSAPLRLPILTLVSFLIWAETLFCLFLNRAQPPPYFLTERGL